MTSEGSTTMQYDGSNGLAVTDFVWGVATAHHVPHQDYLVVAVHGAPAHILDVGDWVVRSASGNVTFNPSSDLSDQRGLNPRPQVLPQGGVMGVQRFAPKPVEPEIFTAMQYDGSNDSQILDFVGPVASSADHVKVEGSLSLTFYDRFTQELHTGDWVAKHRHGGIRCHTNAAMAAHYIQVP